MKMVLFCIWFPVLFVSGQLKKKKKKGTLPFKIITFLERVTNHKETGFSSDLIGLGEV